jgi:hypothetical protein
MHNIKLNEFYIFGISIKSQSFDVSIVINFLFYKVWVTIGSIRSIIEVWCHKLFDSVESIMFGISCRCLLVYNAFFLISLLQFFIITTEDIMLVFSVGYTIYYNIIENFCDCILVFPLGNFSAFQFWISVFTSSKN